MNILITISDHDYKDIGYTHSVLLKNAIKKGDVVQHCKECAYWDSNVVFNNSCLCSKLKQFTTDGFYCAYSAMKGKSV